MDIILEKAKEMDLNTEGLQVGQANIKVIGVGGAGNNMVSWLYKKGIRNNFGFTY